MSPPKQIEDGTVLTAKEKDMLHWLLVYNDPELAAKTAGYDEEEILSGEVDKIIQSLRFQRVYKERRNARKKFLDIDQGWVLSKLVDEVNRQTKNSVKALELISTIRGFLIEKKEIHNIPELDMQKLYRMSDDELAMHLMGMLQNMLPENKRVVIQTRPEEDVECIVQPKEDVEEASYYAIDDGPDQEEGTPEE